MNAARQRKYRRRQRDGAAVFCFEGDAINVPEMLIEAGYLSPDSAEDAEAISCALAEMVRVLARYA